MLRIVIGIAAFAALAVFSLPSAPAQAGQVIACPAHAVQSGRCYYSQPRAPQTHFRERHREVIGYRNVVVRRPVYGTRRAYEPRVMPPPSPPPVMQPQGCSDCAIDLDAVYMGCVTRNGKQVWQYRAANGIVYNMTMQRMKEADKIRLFPDGRVVWVKS